MQSVKVDLNCADLMTYDRDLLGNDIKKKLDLKEHPDQGVYVQSKCFQDTCCLFLTTHVQTSRFTLCKVLKNVKILWRRVGVTGIFVLQICILPVLLSL